MSKSHKVVIDGIFYVPASESVSGVDDFMQAIYETYMGAGKRWDQDHTDLWVAVNEDGDGDTFEELAARIAEIAARGDGMNRESTDSRNEGANQ